MAQPNLLLVLVDSAKYNAYRVNGGVAETPALERLANEGVNCPRCWATTPICHPSRSSIITGLYPYSHGMLTNSTFAGGWPFSVHPNVPTLPGLLREAGYRTGYAGQQHIVLNDWDDDRHEMTAEYHRWLQEQGYTEAPLAEDRGYLCGRVGYTADQTREGRFTARGLELLDDLCGQSQPWFMQLDFDGPHLPCWVPDEFATRYEPASLPLPPTLRDNLAGRPEWIRMARDRQGSFGTSEEEWRKLTSFYLGEIAMIDSLVGRVLERLDQHGAADNTVVVFTSDHATPVGCHGFASHGGPALYEDVLRVPFAVRWPAGLPAGQPCQQAMRHVDLVPTLLDLAGVETTAQFQGRSAAAAWRGEVELTDESYHVYSGTGASFLSVRAYRLGRWKFVYTPYGGSELYDLETDPDETDNLVGCAHAAEIEDQIRRAMCDAMAAADDPLARSAKRDLGA